MSNTELAVVIETTIETVSFSRTTKKGEVTRGLLGLLTSGNKEERASAAALFVMDCWDTGRLRPLVNEFGRVFGGKGFDGIVRVLDIDLEKPNKGSVAALLGALIRGTKNRVLKGERALYRGYAVDLVAKHKANEVARLAKVAQGSITA